MADIWMDVDVALSEVPVNIMPLVDDTDFKTRETAVAYNASGMDLVWNFVTTGGAYTQTAVTPTTGGSYDWTHQGDGMYSIEIPASGGASINNDTEGFGWFTGLATGVLPWRGPVIGFRAAALNDALIDGGDLLDVSVTQWAGTAVATPDTAGYPKVTVKSGTGTGEISLSSGRVALQNAPLTKNVAVPDWGFVMTDSTNHNPATSKTVTVYYSHDGGDTYTSLGTATESAAADGGYFIDISQAAMNADKIMLKMTAAGCDTLWQLITTRA